MKIYIGKTKSETHGAAMAEYMGQFPTTPLQAFADMIRGGHKPSEFDLYEVHFNRIRKPNKKILIHSGSAQKDEK